MPQASNNLVVDVECSAAQCRAVNALVVNVVASTKMPEHVLQCNVMLAQASPAQPQACTALDEGEGVCLEETRNTRSARKMEERVRSLVPLAKAHQEVWIVGSGTHASLDRTLEWWSLLVLVLISVQVRTAYPCVKPRLSYEPLPLRIICIFLHLDVLERLSSKVRGIVVDTEYTLTITAQSGGLRKFKEGALNHPLLSS